MVFVRYDHRKLAYNQVKFRKKRRRSDFFNYDAVTEDKLVSGALGGTLGGGKQTVTNAGLFLKDDKKVKGSNRMTRRGTVHISAHTRNQLELKLDDQVSADGSLQPPIMTRIDESYIEFDGGNNDVTEVDALNNVMMHLEEKQKKRNQEKMSEDFAEIKSNLHKIFSDYGLGDKSSDEDANDFDMRMLTDPEFLTNDDEEKNSAKSTIQQILDWYETVCQERSDILEHVHDCLDIDGEEIENSLLKRLHITASGHGNGDNEIEDISSEITMTIENIARKTQKLKRLYNKLLKLCLENRNQIQLPGNFENETNKKVREMNLQQKVVGQFKKLHTTKNVRKEKVETWKYAANEIVDLLKSVRQEGATDFERLEKEFKRLLDAFNAQNELLQEVQLKLEKKEESLKKNEAIREKLRNDNLILQDDIDRYRVQNRTAQMKIQQLQGDIEIKNKEIKEKSDVVSKKLATVLPHSNEEEVEVASNIISNIDNKELYDKINALQKLVTKYENEIGVLNAKNKQLLEEINTNKKSDALNSKLEQNQFLGDSLSPSSENQTVIQRMPSSFSSQDCYECQSKQLKIHKLMSKIKDLVEEKDMLIQKFADSNVVSSYNTLDNYDVPKNTPDIHLDAAKESKSPVEAENPVENTSLEQKDSIVSDYIESESSKEVGEFEVASSTNDKEDDVIITPSNQARNTVVYQEIYVEKTTLKSYDDKATQIDEELEWYQKPAEENDGKTEPARFSDEVDSEISSIADKIFGFVNLAGKLTRKIHRPKTSSHSVPKPDEHRPVTLPAISRDDMSHFKEEQNLKARNGQLMENKGMMTNKNGTLNSIPTGNSGPGKGNGVAASSKQQRALGYGKEANQHFASNVDNNMDLPVGTDGSNLNKEVGVTSTSSDADSNEIKTLPRNDNDLLPKSTQPPGRDVKGNIIANKPNGKGIADNLPDNNSMGNNQKIAENSSKPVRVNEKPAETENMKIAYKEKTFPDNNLKKGDTPTIFPHSDKYEKSVAKVERARNMIQPTLSNIHGDNEAMQRSWTESGFFDDSSLNPTKVARDNRSFWHGQAGNKHTGWNRLRYGRSHQVLRFLSRIAKSKCSLLSHESNNIHKEAKTPEEAVVAELSVFADHAIDLLDIISFALKRIEIEHAEEELENKLLEQSKNNAGLVTATKTTWEQESSVAEDGAARKVQFHDSNKNTLSEHHPDKSKMRHSARHSARHRDTPVDDEDKVAKAARKRRQRILERHKKLVERLRASGVGMKQIYTILGISKSPNDDDELSGEDEHPVPPALKKAQQEQIRRMSLIGHSFNGAPANQLHHLKSIHEQSEKKSTMFPLMSRKQNHLIDAARMNGHRKPVVSNSKGVRRSSLFPPIAIKATGGPMSTNFFKTKPLANFR